MLGLPGEDAELPANVRSHLHTFGDEVYGDFKVCPLTKERKGQMQMVCVQSASKLRFRHVPD